jgi:hypothetical protein
MALVDIANNALGKIGGAGDEVSGEGIVTAAQLSANTIKTCQWINTKYPTVRKKAIKDFAAMGCPFPETQKFADLGTDLKQYDIAIESVVSSGAVVTITTQEAHGRSTGDTVYLTGIAQDDAEDFDDIEQALITSLNGTTKTITVVDSTSFSLDSTTGVDLTWVHEANTGIVSYVPEMGAWEYAFILPSDLFCMVRQCNESYTTKHGVRRTYQYRRILNKDGDGWLLLTNSLSNLGGNGAYIEYCIDQTDFTLFSPAFEEVIAMLLAYEICPIVGRNLEVRQRLMVEYRQVTVPDAKRENQSQFNNRAKVVTDFSGGRTSGGVVPRRASDLGTYVDKDGNRQEI